jgi:hypothetical protein
VRRGVAEHNGRIVEGHVLAASWPVTHPGDAREIDEQRIDFTSGFDDATGFADEPDQAVGQCRRSPAHIVAAAGEI